MSVDVNLIDSFGSSADHPITAGNLQQTYQDAILTLRDLLDEQLIKEKAK